MSLTLHSGQGFQTTGQTEQAEQAPIQPRLEKEMKKTSKLTEETKPDRYQVNQFTEKL